MKKFIFIILITILFGTFVFGQKSKTKPDYSGVWVLDKEMSAASLKRKAVCGNITFYISHKDPEFKIEKYCGEKENGNFVGKETLFTDKRKETTSTFIPLGGENNIESETRWKKNSIFRKFKTNKSRYSLVARTEKFELSEDGKTLIFTYDMKTHYFQNDIRAQNANGEPVVPSKPPEGTKEKLFFNKKEE